MTVESVTLHIPKHIIDRARERAESSDQQLEAILVRELESAFLPELPPDEEAELHALEHLSDDALWTIAREQLSDSRQKRLQALMDGNTRGTISNEERVELQQLVLLSQQLTLRKGKAMALLKERGHSVSREHLRD